MTERKINHLSSLKDLERQSRTKVKGIQKKPHITDKLIPVNSGYLHSGDVLSRKCIGSVTDQEASLTHSSIETGKKNGISSLVNISAILALIIQ